MSILIFRPSASTAVPAPSSEPSFPPVPQLYARVAWRSDALTRLAWDGASTAGWTTIGSTLSSTSSDSFGGGSSLEMVTAGTAGSGIAWSFGTATFISGVEYRARVGEKLISGSSSGVVKLGTAADNAAATATITNGWAWYTVDWTPGADRTSVLLSLLNGAAATQTTRIDHAEVYESADDVTLESLAVTRGSRFDGGREPPGTIDFTVLDPDAVYTPRNTASPLYPYVDAGKKVHIRATYGGRLYAIAYGTVREVTPDPDTRTVAFSAEDGLAELERDTTERAFSVSLSYRAARDSATGSRSTSLATDSTEASTFIDGTDDETSLLDYLESLNEATGTVHVAMPHVEAIDPWRYTTITRATLTDSRAGSTIDEDFQSLSDVSVRDESLITHQRCTWVGYEPRAPQTIVEATKAIPYLVYTDDAYGSTDYPEPEDVFAIKRSWRKYGWVRDKEGKRHRVKKRHQVRKRKRVGIRWEDAVVPFTLLTDETNEVVIDFAVPVVVNSYGFGGSGTTPDLSLDTEVGRATLTFTGTSGTAITSYFSLTGTPYMPLDEAEETSGTGDHEGDPMDSERWPSAGAAAGMADYVTWRYGSGRLRPSVVDQHNPVRQLTLDVGSHVTLSADRWFIDGVRCVVRSIEHSVGEAGLAWQTTYGLEELPTAADWFTLDGGAALGLDSSAVLAH